jgi:CRP/FNR family transcriptional regulator, cyclic AMP receptor protein
MPPLAGDTPLSALPADLAATLFRRGRPMVLGPNEALFLAGDSGNGCYRIDEGLLKVSVIAPSGAERILAILGPGAIVGELAMIDGGPRSASATAIGSAKLVFISRLSFDAFTEAHPEVYRQITTLLTRRLRDIDESLAASSLLPLKGRVARALLSLADAFGKDVGSGRIVVQQKVSQSDLAAMAGIARENVSRILQEWTRGALVTRHGGYYCLENRAALKREATI